MELLTAGIVVIVCVFVGAFFLQMSVDNQIDSRDEYVPEDETDVD